MALTCTCSCWFSHGPVCELHGQGCMYWGGGRESGVRGRERKGEREKTVLPIMT